MDNYDFCAMYIRDYAAGRPINVLDYGCGAGQIVMKLREMGIDAKGCDIFYKGTDRSKLVPSQLFGSIIKRMKNGLIPFSDKSFDFVVNNQVIEHVQDIDHALYEIHRVLKPGGQMLSLFPDKSVWREGHCGVPFLHWFPKGSRSRVYYAAFMRTIGFGYKKGTKPIWQWSLDFCEYLDQWTWYRSATEIHIAFDKKFTNFTGIEDIWLQARMGGWQARIFGWLPKWTVQWIVRKLGGWVFICTKKETSVTSS